MRAMDSRHDFTLEKVFWGYFGALDQKANSALLQVEGLCQFQFQLFQLELRIGVAAVRACELFQITDRRYDGRQIKCSYLFY